MVEEKFFMSCPGEMQVVGELAMFCAQNVVVEVTWDKLVE